MAGEILKTLIVQSAMGGALILLMLLLRKLFAGKVSARLTYALWLVIAIRLLVPLELPAFPVNTVPAEAEIVTEVRMAEPFRVTKSFFTEIKKQTAANMPAIPKTETRVQKAEKPQTTYEEVSTAAPSKKSISIPKETLILTLYAAGVVLTATYMTMVNVRMGRRLRSNAQRVNVPGRIPVYQTDTETPRLAGLFHPRIYIGTETDEKTLEYVIAHETAHFKTGDNFWLLLKNIVCALYWFHPLVWVAGNAMMKDCERACDERVTRRLSREAQLAYAETLMLLGSMKTNPALLTSGMASQKGEMKMRIAGIITGRKTKRWIAALMTILLLLTSAVSFATGEEKVRLVSLPQEIDAREWFFNPPSIALQDGKMTLLADGMLYSETEDDKWVLTGEYPEAVSMTVNGADTYIAERNESGDTISRLDAKGNRAESWKLPEEIQVRRMVVCGNRIALTAYAGYEYEGAFAQCAHFGKPYVLNLADGTLTALTFETVIDLAVDENGQLYALYETSLAYGWKIARVDAKTRRYENLFDIDPLVASEIVASTEGIYYLDNSTNSIEFICFEDGSTSRIVNGNALNLGDMIGMAYDDGKMRIYSAVDESYVRFELFEVAAEAVKKTRTLTIVRDDSQSIENQHTEYMIQWFEENYPEVKIEYRRFTRHEQLLAALMNPDDGIDMIYNQSNSILKNFADSGALMPIADVPGLQAAIDAEDYLDYTPLMSHDGVLYGVPKGLTYMGLWVNTALLESLELTWPEAPYSWTELIDWAIEALEGTEYKFVSEGLITPERLYFDWQWQEHGEIQLDTEVFRTSMEAYQRLYQAGLVSTDFQDDKEGRILIARISPRDGRGIALPTLEGNEVNLMQATGFFVSKNTDDLDLVSAYLCEFVSAECQHIAGYPNMGDMLFVNTDGYSREWVNYDYEHFGEVRTFTEEENAIRMQYIADPVMYWSYPYDIFSDNREVMLKYLEGELTLDEYIAIAQAKIDLVQYE